MPPTPARSLSMLTLAALAALNAAPGYAAPVFDASTEAQVGATIGAEILSSSSSRVSSSTTVNETTGSASGYSFANQYGAYAVSSNAAGLASSASAQAQLLYTLTNTSSVAQRYSMSFHIYGGSISTYLNSSDPAAALVAGESTSASYAARIRVGGTQVFNSAASILTTDTGSVFTLATGAGDTRLNDGGDDGSDGFYSWGSGDYTIDLGILAAGASIDVLAEVADAATSNVGTYSYTGLNCTGYGYGNGNGLGDAYGGPIVCTPETLTDFKGGARAFYGDPVQFDSTDADTAGISSNFFSFTGVQVNAVPEPASLPLVALALLGSLVASRRRRN